MCQGVVLLHHYEHEGTRLLTASFNPSSTYLFKVNERDLFEGLTKQLEIFCEENEFDMIGVSINNAIRTNRTGSEFERAMDARIKETEKSFSLEFSQPFSYTPSYQQQHFDIIWQRKTK